MSWAWKPERAPECTNGMKKCQEFSCFRTVKRAGYCRSCRKLRALRAELTPPVHHAPKS